MFFGSFYTYKATTELLLASGIIKKLSHEIVLIKGARPFGFDHVAELLEMKAHQTILEVNLNHLVNNVNRYRSFMSPHTRMICMVKASAYGTGAVEVSRTLQDHKVDYLAVAVADEGVTLRREGITAGIIVMNPETTAFKEIFDYRLEPEIYSFSMLNAIIKSGHESVLEHASITVRFIISRAIANEIVRHRIASYSQESTRYCNYGGGISATSRMSIISFIPNSKNIFTYLIFYFFIFLI